MRRRISKKQALALIFAAAMLTACSQGKTGRSSEAAKESAASAESSAVADTTTGTESSADSSAAESSDSTAAESTGSEAASAGSSGAEAEVSAANGDILAVSPGGAQFPDMDLAVPTTEPAPEIIRIGTRNWIVKDLQARLMQLGFMDNDEPTDYYGEVTAAAVKVYQRQNKLPQDGIVGESTLKAIMDENAHYYTAQEGDSGTDIQTLQQRLYQLGYLAQTTDVSGTYDAKTLVAVQKFQQMNGLSDDGKVGLKTMNLIYSDEVKPNMVVYGEKSDIVMAAQQRLKALGYLTGEADGNFGLGTVMAIKEFQSRNNQVVDGYLGPGTRDALNSPNAQPFGLTLGDESDSVEKVQELLSKWGYLDKQLATGYYGEATKNAVKAFQERNGLTADGSVGASTMAKPTSNDVVKPAPKPKAKTPKQNNDKPKNGGKKNGSSGSQGGGGGSSYTYSGSGSVGTLLSVASSKLGTPYVWGAKGDNAFDCSGFVYWCLNHSGVSQSYMTSGGWASSGRGQRINSYSELQAGDIIVVSGHVGIVAGGGGVIDASSSNGRVVHRSLNGWWERNFICGWRIF